MYESHTRHSYCSKVSMATSSAFSSSKISLKASPGCSLMDETVSIEVGGLMPKQAVTLRSFFDDEGKQFESHAHYTSKDDGSVNTTNQPSEGGLFTGVEPMGLFWSMVACPSIRYGTRYMKRNVTKPLIVNISVHHGHLDGNQVREDESPMATASVERWYMGKDVELIKVSHGRIQGSLLKPKGPGPFPAVVDMFGGVLPGCNEIRAALLASKGYAAFSLAYFWAEGESQFIAADVLEMEYFEEAVDWLCSQPFVQPGGVATIGVCKGGEMALAMAIHLPAKIRATVGISSCGTFTICPTTYKGETFPYAMFIKESPDGDQVFAFPFSPDGSICLRDFSNGCMDYDMFQKFENIRCPALIICSEEDECVPSHHSQRISELIKTNGYNNECKLVTYPGAGHLIEPPYTPLCSISYQPPWGMMRWGGTPKDHSHACEDAWRKLLEFLKQHMGDNHRTIPSKL